MPTVRIPRAMQALTGGLVLVTAEGRNVKQVINALELTYPGLKAALMDADRLKPDVRVAVDGQICPLGLMHSLNGAEEVTFLPAMSGG